MLDYNSTGSYNLTYGPLTPIETIPPSSHVDSLPAESYTEIPVTWTGTDNPGGSGIDYYDIYTSVNGEPFTVWLSHNDATGSVYEGKLGNTYAFYSVATDNAGNKEAAHTSADATTKVSRVNHAPILSPIPDQSINEGDRLSLTPTATDPDGDLLTWSLVDPAPAGVQVNPDSGVILWQTAPGMGHATNQLTVQVLDNGIPRLGSLRRFHVSVAAVNHAPEVPPISDQTVAEGHLLTVSASAIDPDLPPQQLRYQLGAGAPSGTTVDQQSGVFSWRPNNVQGGTNYLVSILATDNGSPSMECDAVLPH